MLCNLFLLPDQGVEVVEPSEWCLSDGVEEVVIGGEGFTDGLVREDATCTFETESNQRYGETNTHTHTHTRHDASVYPSIYHARKQQTHIQH